ncbi:hypothetical protein LCGC14_1150860 [marine sediment metagenome]|uniref:Uncharacterized protein n=1 Tax=marine sediment metagenome TaxID=412755 RepID=A0A0F9PDN5_9ZZZZ
MANSRQSDKFLKANSFFVINLPKFSSEATVPVTMGMSPFDIDEVVWDTSGSPYEEDIPVKDCGWQPNDEYHEKDININLCFLNRQDAVNFVQNDIIDWFKKECARVHQAIINGTF